MPERNQFKGVNSIKFHNTFSCDDDCYRYLADIKWHDLGYHCKKCGHTKYCKGVKPFSRRCMKCKYDESPTVGTMFDKNLVVVALEIVEGGVGRAYAQCINNASAASFRPFFETYISRDSKVITDEWKGYIPLKKAYPNLKQLKSENGKSFQDIHIHIMNLKGWLLGIHHHCSKEHLQGYLDEYHFRYNRRSNMDTIFDSLIKRMVLNNPIRLQSIN